MGLRGTRIRVCLTGRSGLSFALNVRSQNNLQVYRNEPCAISRNLFTGDYMVGRCMGMH
jgi:hypothetical protein